MPENHFPFTHPYGRLSKRLLTEVTISTDISGFRKAVHAKALWDTGATISAITPQIAKELGVPPVTRIPIAGVHNTSMADVVTISVILPNQVQVSDMQAAVCALNGNIGMIIGMDIMLLGDFAVSNSDGNTVLSFVMPSLKEKVDFTRKVDQPS